MASPAIFLCIPWGARSSHISKLAGRNGGASVRVTPDRFIELTDVPGVKPARFRGRFHWVTIVNVHTFHVAYLENLVEWSYQRALGSLTKAQQNSVRTLAA